MKDETEDEESSTGVGRGEGPPTAGIVFWSKAGCLMSVSVSLSGARYGACVGCQRQRQRSVDMTVDV